MERSLLEELKTLWDELKLQSHLFTMEVSDRWHNLEERFHKLRACSSERSGRCWAV
jgi:hypothetical protein